ncbi:MAG: PKD domain-containing protein, partial [Vicingaceae bacterium]
YSGPGFYNVSLSVWYPNGCFDQRTQINAVQMLPCIGNDSVVGGLSGDYAGAFNDTLDPIYACAPFQLELNIADDSLRNIWWDFGDGNFSTSFNPSHTYIDRGNYSLQMIIEDKYGQFDTVLNRNYIRLSKPRADFQFDIENACNNNTVNFQNQSSFATQYEWNLGSIGSSTNIHPSVTYNQSGNELIELTAIDSNACTDRTVKNISLGSPNPFFDFNSQLCLGDTVKLASNVLNYSNYEWQIGSQILNGDTVKYIARDTGRFTVRIRAYDTNSCSTTFTSTKQLIVSDPKADFIFKDSPIACDYYDLNVSNLSSGAEDYIWLLGNGDSLFDKNQTYRYRDSGVFELQLFAFKEGCVDISNQKQLTVNRAYVDFELQQNSNCLPIQAQFLDRSSAAVSWSWSFGDGDSSSVKNPQHTFTQKSDFQSLNIVDTNGCKARVEKSELKVHRAVPQADRWEGCAPLTIQFSDSTQNVVNYFWDFGDGNTSNQQFPSHTYDFPGTYDLRLISQSVEGCYDTTVIESAIVAGSVEADFSTSALESACAPHMAVFENHSKGAVNYAWSFGDGKQSTKETPIHVYHNAGQFDVQLIVDNGFSCTDTLVKENRFNINTPEVNFSMTDSAFCGSHEVEFKDLSKRIASRKWFFGDGSTSTDLNPTHFYDEVKRYTVSLIVTDTAGCVENLSKSIRIKRKPIASFSLDSSYSCVPASISFRNHSSELESPTYKWVLNQETYAAFDTTLIFNEQASYDVSLVVENANACADTLMRENHLKIYEEEQSNHPKVKRVNRNDKGDWLIEWEQNEDFNFKYYQLYRKNANGNFVPYVQLWNQNQSQYQIGFRSNWQSQQCFKMETVKYCSEQESIEEIQSYCSIDLQASRMNDVIRLKWT